MSSRHLATPADALARLRSALGDLKRRRVPLSDIQALFARSCPELAELPDARTRLHDLLAAAASAKCIALPKGRIHYDRSGLVPLPRFVHVLGQKARNQPIIIGPRLWHPLLAFAAHERHPGRLAVLGQINVFLSRATLPLVPVPIKERSLEIFGDEKRLERFVSGGTLFGCRLTLAQLGCFVSPIAMPCELGPAPTAGKPILLVENHDTWTSFRLWNRNAARYGAVAFGGGGNQKGLQHDEGALDLLQSELGASGLVYFGDIDPMGVLIPARADARRRARGACPLLPEAALYRWLLDHGRPVPHRTRIRVTSDALAWLPAELRGRIEALLAQHLRVAQESIGTEALVRGRIF